MALARCTLSLLMGGRDLTKWAESISVSQSEHTLYRQWSATLRGFVDVDLTARWDIYGSYDAETPYSEVVMRGGVVPPDNPPTVSVDRAGVPSITLAGYDWAWMVQHITAPSTIVLAPTFAAARAAVVRESGPVGRYSVVQATTIHGAVLALAAMAGIRVELRLPDAALAPNVLDPSQSVWDSIMGLVEPWAPVIYFRRDSNTVLIGDRLAEITLTDTVATFGDAAIRKLAVTPRRTRNLRRILVGLTPWR